MNTERYTNNYTKYFLQQLHKAIESSVYTQLPESEDCKLIDDIVQKYYSTSFFNIFLRNKQNRLKLNPVAIEDFNFTMINLINEIVRLLFYNENPFSYQEKNIFFNYLMKFICNELQNLQLKQISNVEIVNEIIIKIDNEYDSITKKHGYEFEGSYILSTYQKLQEYLNQKLISSSNNFYSFIDSNYDFNLYSNIIIVFCIISIVLALFIQTSSPYINIIIEIILIETILISLSVSIFLMVTRNKMQKINLSRQIIPYYERLGVDVISIYVSEKELKYAEPEQKNIMLPLLSDIRLYITDKYGFVIPNIRVMDSLDLKSGYKILIRGNEILNIDISMEDFIITDEQIKKYNIQIDSNLIKQENEFASFYIVDKNFCKNLDENAYYIGEQFFKEILCKLFMRYVNLIFTLEETVYFSELFKSAFHHSDNDIENYIDIYDLQEILIKLLQKKCSIKDVIYVFRKIIQYSKESKDVNYIVFQIYKDMVKDKFIVE